MRRIVDTAYRADADGNRGETRVFYEIEAEDEPEIRKQVQQYLIDYYNPDDTLEAVLFDPITDEEVYFTVRVKDYV